MALRKVAFKATVTNDTYTRLIAQSHSKRSMHEQEQSSVLIKKNWEQLIESSKSGIIIRENHLFNNCKSASDLLEKESPLEVVSVTMADVIVEAAMAEIERKIKFLMKAVEERDHEIAALKDQMQTCETTESIQTLVVKTGDKGKNVVQENQPQQKSVSVAFFSVQQL
ncbi:ty3-gypsy retrotransposon protein [Cucumis melo var. makuwa]|uniref:Ty3-gypsy retrotransposon protein n=1 Tax=Cucumis melo var. makuwa TaxID=1194695 RepID=A0A5D3CPD0_CUCMM|nr:ty3-gypsy retrotransposon protein [Cucumis melo var. makuwa]TYK13753.1 ty3-gypsy retrotransposon protein [Cucumis melo var. makuwa]